MAVMDACHSGTFVDGNAVKSHETVAPLVHMVPLRSVHTRCESSGGVDPCGAQTTSRIYNWAGKAWSNDPGGSEP
jgi:hypothetical protein